MSTHDPSSTTDTRRSFIAKSAAVGVGAGMAGVFARPASGTGRAAEPATEGHSG